ncbi:MAG: ABC transporter permease subunit [Coxiellaceae bacterium]|jgi:spermidine/putrescine transport system permease protein|nr:ABC transporter permease subunit [Coxiellaceae bacterium]
MKKKTNSFEIFSISIIWLWLGIFAILPIGITFITSFLTQDPDSIVQLTPTLANYSKLLNHAYINVLLQSLYLASSCTIICLIIGYPFAFIIARSQNKYKSLLLLLVIIPFWTSSLIRTYAIMAILKTKGILNMVLLAIGVIHEPLQILYSYTAVLIGCVYDLLPFMILPLYAILEKLNSEYLEAAKDLGAGWFTTLIKIVIPLTKSGIIAGSVLVFLPAMTMFYIPVLLGGAKNLLIGNLVEQQFLSVNNWPLGTAISVIITLLMGILIIIYWHNSKEESRKI